jgi:hypothetical protein
LLYRIDVLDDAQLSHAEESRTKKGKKRAQERAKQSVPAAAEEMVLQEPPVPEEALRRTKHRDERGSGSAEGSTQE